MELAPPVLTLSKRFLAGCSTATEPRWVRMEQLHSCRWRLRRKNYLAENLDQFLHIFSLRIEPIPDSTANAPSRSFLYINSGIGTTYSHGLVNSGAGWAAQFFICKSGF